MAAEPSSLARAEPPRYRLVDVVGQEKDLRLFLSEFPAEVKALSQRDGNRLALRLVLSEAQVSELPKAKLESESSIDLALLGQRLLKQVGPGTGFDLVLRTLGLMLPTHKTYLDCAAVAAATRSLAKAYPSHCELLDLETTARGTPCQALSIAGKAPPGAPCILILGGQHACEWGSCEIALHFVERLLGAYSAPGHRLVLGKSVFSASEVKRFIETRHIVVFPLVNPDGRGWSQAYDLAWRKNLHPPVSAEEEQSPAGVDINRNFDFLFELGDAFSRLGGQVSTEQSNYLYQGPSPFSESESRNVRTLLDRFPATSWLVDLHASGQKILYPWSIDETQIDNPEDSFLVNRANPQRGLPGDGYAEYMRPEDKAEYERLAANLARGIVEAGGEPFKCETGFAFAPSPGTCHDYAYSRHLVSRSLGKVLAFAVEWGRTSYPEWSAMQPIVAQVASGLMRFSLATRHPLP